MLYMESRKSFEVGGMKKINSLPSVKKYSSNYHLCRVPKIIYSVNKSLPSVKKHSTNTYLYRVPKIIHSTKNYLLSVFILPSVFCVTLGKDLICQVPETIHSAKVQHSGTQKFPVVIATLYA